jgi:hypothetical protein
MHHYDLNVVTTPAHRALLIRILARNNHSLRISNALIAYARESVEICSLLDDATLKVVVGLNAAKANYLAPAVMHSFGAVCEHIPDNNITVGAVVAAIHHGEVSHVENLISRAPESVVKNSTLHNVLIKTALASDTLDLLELIVKLNLAGNWIISYVARAKDILVANLEYVLFEIGHERHIPDMLHIAKQNNNTYMIQALSMYSPDE